MERSLAYKIAVVTGGARGIGYEIAEHFLKENAKTVIILDINEENGGAAVNNLNCKHGEGKAKFIKCDVTKDLDEVSKKIFDSYKQVDILVNNAGAVDESSARKTIELNCTAVIEWSMKFWQHMRKDKGGNGGTIFNIGSIYSYVIDPYLVFYKASKHAVRGFTESLGHEQNYRQFGVRLLVIFPGYTYSEMTTKQKLCWAEHEEGFKEFIKARTWQNVEDVGNAAVAVFQNGDSGSSWNIIGGKLTEVQSRAFAY